MEYLQYKQSKVLELWGSYVLNLVIRGIPSILTLTASGILKRWWSFKPCYKWNTFNTFRRSSEYFPEIFVLNLVISGMPSILATPSSNDSGSG